jgi:hypothetical protein
MLELQVPILVLRPSMLAVFKALPGPSRKGQDSTLTLPSARSLIFHPYCRCLLSRNFNLYEKYYIRQHMTCLHFIWITQSQLKRLGSKLGCYAILVVHSHGHLERVFSLHLKFLYICAGIIYPLKLHWFFLTLPKLKIALLRWKHAKTPPSPTHPPTHTHTQTVPSPSLTVTSLSDVTQPHQLEKHSHTGNSSTLYNSSCSLTL